MTSTIENTEAGNTGDNTGAVDRDKLSRQFNRVVRRAQAAIFLERAWPKVAAPSLVGGLFLTASWAGLWQPLPPEARIAGVLAFAAAALISPFLTKTESLRVTQDDALQRLDDNIGDPSRPARTLRDKLAETSPPVEQEIWDLHLSGMWDKWGGKFKAGRPRSDLQKRDPYAIRLAVAVCMVAAAAMAGENRMERVTDAFNWSAPVVQAAPITVKAWVTPPERINQAPIYLTEETNDQTVSENELNTHKNSMLTILTIGEKTRIFVNGEEAPVQKTMTVNNKGQEKSTFQYEIMLTEGSTNVVIENGPEWRFSVSPDNSPTATINSASTNAEDPSSIEIIYSTNDDFGVEEGILTVNPSKKDPEAKPLPSAKIPPIILR